MSTGIKMTAKTALVFPFTFHVYNGIRHLVSSRTVLFAGTRCGLELNNLTIYAPSIGMGCRLCTDDEGRVQYRIRGSWSFCDLLSRAPRILKVFS
jgi:hypothetical protein